MRKPLICLWTATKLYGEDNTTFVRPQYVKGGYCQWCGKRIEGKRRKSFCCTECSNEFHRVETWGRTRNAYSNHLLRRDNYTCQICGEFHAWQNKHGIHIPTDDGKLELHHITYVCNGGTDSPQNLIALCKQCHLEVHKELKLLESEVVE